MTYFVLCAVVGCLLSYDCLVCLSDGLSSDVPWVIYIRLKNDLSFLGTARVIMTGDWSPRRRAAATTTSSAFYSPVIILLSVAPSMQQQQKLCLIADWGAVLCYMNDSCRIAWWILLLVAQNQKIKCSLRVCRVRISLSPSLQIDIDWSVIDIWWSLKIILKHAPEMTGNRDRAGSESLLLGWLVVLS